MKYFRRDDRRDSGQTGLVIREIDSSVRRFKMQFTCHVFCADFIRRVKLDLFRKYRWPLAASAPNNSSNQQRVVTHPDNYTPPREDKPTRGR